LFGRQNESRKNPHFGPPNAQREQTIVTFAARELRRRDRKLKKASADFKTPDQAARHAVWKSPPALAVHQRS
jgi:hypothetical protein